MSISAYLDQEQDTEVEDIRELGSTDYKMLADNLSITTAEQAIIDDVAGIDGCDEEDEKDEKESEREMKTLFEALYEIDPDTKEVFVKGSAYDLKKWEDDMVCFTFGSTERGIAMEDAIHPEERRLMVAQTRLNAKSRALSALLKKHSSDLSAKTISRSFAEDFNLLMGHPIANIRMESFTKDPSSTNYELAMEDMSAVQMAVTAGAALAGVGIVYKLIQWFSKSLNKNGEATNKISQNFTNYKERKNKIDSADADAKLDQETIDKVMVSIDADLRDNPSDNASKAISQLKKSAKEKLEAAVKKQIPSDVFNTATAEYLKVKMETTFTPFHLNLLTSKLDTAWWTSLGNVVDDGLKALDALTAALEAIATATELENNKPDLIDFAFLDHMSSLKISTLVSGDNSNFKEWNKSTNNWEEATHSFMAAAASLMTPYADISGIDTSTFKLENVATLNIEVFAKFSQKKIDDLTANAEKLKTESQAAYTAIKASGSTTDGRIEKRRDRMNILAKEFTAVANIIRFVIQVRNQLGTLSVALNYSSEKASSFFPKIFGGIGDSINKVTNTVKDSTKALKKGMR